MVVAGKCLTEVFDVALFFSEEIINIFFIEAKVVRHTWSTL